MNNAKKDNKGIEIDFFIDITGEVCPLTFVKTKLLIESMSAGQTAEVRLKGREPLENVPRSVNDSGHSIISLEAESPSEPADGIHRLILKKAPDS
ncbi:MAG TPA: sulfurtransferase TusA family protein [Rhodospirillales bacterium]|jgi:TusA-related sulfurtransferase|nr:sulfurtransferase TusA family protein [Rhodospirillales bacterium]